jgi:predicted dehydrogenase
LVRNTDDDVMVPMTAEDQVAVTGTLAGGAVASVHFRGGRSRGTNLLWEINGTEGDILVTSRSGQLHSSKVEIRGARGGDRLADLPVPDPYDLFPALGGQPAHAIAHAYAQLVDDVAAGTGVVPDFAHGRRRHEMLQRIQDAAADGRRRTIP